MVSNNRYTLSCGILKRSALIWCLNVNYIRFCPCTNRVTGIKARKTLPVIYLEVFQLW